MSTIKSSADHIVINADGASKDIKFQANGVEKASISSAGAFTSTTIDATALTGNLPAISGASLTSLTSGNLTGALPVISGANLTNLPASGITEADIWSLNTSFNKTNANDVLVNLSRKTHKSDKIGTGMSISSGVFTFPSTGLWYIQADWIMYIVTGGGELAGGSIKVTGNNGSSWADSSLVYANPNDTTQHLGVTGCTFFDCTDTSNDKVRFDARCGAANMTWWGEAVSGAQHTAFTFIRLGDT